MSKPKLILLVVAVATMGITAPPAASASPNLSALVAASVADEILVSAVPTITGKAAVGATISVHAGTWPAGTTFTYQWSAGGKPIAKALQPKLVIPATALKMRITVSVTGTVPGFAPVTKKSVPTTAVAAGSLTAPVPTVVGTAAVGAKLTAKPGTWTSGTRLAYQWLAGGRPIAKATSSTLTVTAAMLHTRITVRVTGTNTGYTTAVKTSVPTAPVGKAPKTATPTISGKAAVSSVLTAKPGAWTAGTKFSYQWFAAGKPITGATGATIRLKIAQLGTTITVRVTGTCAGYAQGVRLSAATAKVAADPNAGKNRTSPYSINHAFQLGSWVICLGATNINGWPLIQGENMFNDAPTAGWTYLLVPVTYKRLGAEPKAPWISARIRFIGSNGVAYSAWEKSQSCGVVPDDASEIGDMYAGATAKGNECAVVPTKAVAGGVWRVETDVWNDYRYVASK